MPPGHPARRRDHSYLLQAFRFFVRNNFLMGYAQGEPLQLPEPPAYPAPPPALQWGRTPAEGDAEQRPDDVRALLAAVAGEAVDVELSDEEDAAGGLLLPPLSGAAGRDGGEDAAAASGSEEDEESSEDESGSSGDEGEEEEEEGEVEEGQVGEQAGQGLGSPLGADALASAAGAAGAPAAEAEQEDDLEYS